MKLSELLNFSAKLISQKQLLKVKLAKERSQMTVSRQLLKMSEICSSNLLQTRINPLREDTTWLLETCLNVCLNNSIPMSLKHLSKTLYQKELRVMMLKLASKQSNHLFLLLKQLVSKTSMSNIKSRFLRLFILASKTMQLIREVMLVAG